MCCVGVPIHKFFVSWCDCVQQTVTRIQSDGVTLTDVKPRQYLVIKGKWEQALGTRGQGGAPGRSKLTLSI